VSLCASFFSCAAHYGKEKFWGFKSLFEIRSNRNKLQQPKEPKAKKKKLLRLRKLARKRKKREYRLYVRFIRENEIITYWDRVLIKDIVNNCF
jgi:hypothetical protein